MAMDIKLQNSQKKSVLITGFFINLQSDSYGKACISLKHKELCTGEL